MRIALIRHGRPRVEAGTSISGPGLTDWIGAYDRAGLDPSLPPPARVRRLAESSALLVSSDLPRALESVRAAAPDRDHRVEGVFREAGLPRLPRTPLHLHPQAWALVARIAWFLGRSTGTESALRARERARAGAELLRKLADSHGSVALFGHGMFHALVARELRASGWRGPRWPTGRYWSTAVYRKE